MKKKNFLFLLFIVAIGISIYSCNVGGKGNITTYPPVVAVVDYDIKMGGTTIGTIYGYFATPSLLSYDKGDCIYIQQFTVDSDNQPSDKYYTATGIYGVDAINQSYVEVNNTIELGTSTILFSQADGLSHVCFNGKLFTAASCKDKSPRYRLVYNSSEEEPNGLKNLYLLAGPSPETSSTDFGTLHAFDVLYLIQNYGRDTTVAVTGSSEKSVELKYIDVQLNYLSEISETSEPVFKQAGTPFQIFIYK